MLFATMAGFEPATIQGVVGVAFHHIAVQSGEGR